MPYSYLIDVPRNTVFSRVWGVLTDDEVVSHATGLTADPRFGSDMNQIIDFRDLAEMRTTNQGIRKLASLIPFKPDARRAFVISIANAAELSKAFWTYTEAGVDTYSLFRDLESAMTFVGFDPSTPWPDREPDRTYRSKADTA
jgi:hypothetical protein